MLSATLLEATLSYHDISKGRLAALEGNPFAVLEVERPKKQHRRRKRSQKLFNRAREQLQDTHDSNQIMADRSRNTYEDLYIPSTTFLDLSGELRNAIYDYSITHGQDGQQCSTVERDNGYCAHTLFLKDRGRHPTINEREPHMALLLVNKQVSTEWRSILDRHVAVQIHSHVTLEKTDDSSVLLVGDLEKAFPIVEVKGIPDPADSNRDNTKQYICTTKSRGIYLDLFCYVTGLKPEAGEYIETDADLQTTEEELNFDIITAAGFEDIAKRLRLCDKLEDLIIEWRMQAADWGYVHHPEPGSETPHMLFESMIQVIETIPNLRRYCLTCGGYAMFASRSKGQSWDGETTLRLSHETEEGYFDGPCAQLYQDLQR